MHYTDIIIIGAGAAGLTAAIFAAQGLQRDELSRETGADSDMQKTHLSQADLPKAVLPQTNPLHSEGTQAEVPAPSGSSRETGAVRITLLERTPQPGRKILMSGGTRCNVLPVEMRLDDFVTDSSRNRMRNIFRSWSLDECRRWFTEEIGLRLACERESNKWFPESNSARDVRDLLVRRASGLGVEIRTGASVASVRRSGPAWVVSTDDGVHYGAPVVVFATGGLSIPSTGTDGTGHSIAETLGHTLHPTYPALTPLTGPHPGRDPLPGVSLDVDLEPVFVDAEAAGQSVPDKNKGRRQTATRPVPKDLCPFRTRRSGFLFTHKGWSGPAVLDVSHVIVRAQQGTLPGTADRQQTNASQPSATSHPSAVKKPTSACQHSTAGHHSADRQPSAALRINWTGKSAQWWQEQFEGHHTTTSLLRSHLPRRLADNLLEENGLADRKTAQLSSRERQRLISDLTEYLLLPTGNLGYKKAEVTGGGIPLEEINPATMESRLAHGIFLCGEILDVFGRIGGFNFYWAWVSGRLAGIHAASAASAPDTDHQTSLP